MVDFALLETPKLISHKIWEIEKIMKLPQSELIGNTAHLKYFTLEELRYSLTAEISRKLGRESKSRINTEST